MAGTLDQLQEKIASAKNALQKSASNVAELEKQFLAKHGTVNTLMAELKTLAPELRKEAGQLLNAFRQEVEHVVAGAKTSPARAGWTDFTMPGIKPNTDHVHPVSQAMDEITRIFERIGFIRVRYPEVDWEWYPFDSLNMPKDHPARDEWETFVIDDIHLMGRSARWSGLKVRRQSA